MLQDKNSVLCLFGNDRISKSHLFKRTHHSFRNLASKLALFYLEISRQDSAHSRKGNDIAFSDVFRSSYDLQGFFSTYINLGNNQFVCIRMRFDGNNLPYHNPRAFKPIFFDGIGMRAGHRQAIGNHFARLLNFYIF